MKRLFQLGIIGGTIFFTCGSQTQMKIPLQDSVPDPVSIESMFIAVNSPQTQYNFVPVNTTGLGESLGIRNYKRFVGSGESHLNIDGRDRGF